MQNPRITTPLTLRREIRLQSIHYTYPTALHKPVSENYTLAITGSIGIAGKNTLMNEWHLLKRINSTISINYNSAPRRRHKTISMAYDGGESSIFGWDRFEQRDCNILVYAPTLYFQ